MTEHIADEASDEADLRDRYDPPESRRTSSYAIASFVLGVVALERFPSSVLAALLFARASAPRNTFDGIQVRQSLTQAAVGSVLSAAAAVLAVVLSARAKAEIDSAPGIGGRGFMHAGRIAGYAVAAMLTAAALVTLFLVVPMPDG